MATLLAVGVQLLPGWPFSVEEVDPGIAAAVNDAQLSAGFETRLVPPVESRVRTRLHHTDRCQGDGDDLWSLATYDVAVDPDDLVQLMAESLGGEWSVDSFERGGTLHATATLGDGDVDLRVYPFEAGGFHVEVYLAYLSLTEQFCDD